MNRITRYSQYRIMWLFVFFDLPTETKTDRRVASKFRKRLLEDGFRMFQFSIYLRSCPSKENAQVHVRRVKANLPRHGKISVLMITDAQFGRMQMFFGQKKGDLPQPVSQLQMF